MKSLYGPFEFQRDQAVEWLETNRSGAFCASTIIECPTSKYHGLLVTPLTGAEGRFHILSAVDAGLRGHSGFTLGTNQYPGALYPASYENLSKVELLPVPAWEYEHDGISLRKEIFMRQGEKAVYISYILTGGPAAAELDLKFMFTFRSSHNLTRMNSDINPDIGAGESIIVSPYHGLPPARIEFSGEWEQTGGLYWDKNIEYVLEIERGLEGFEDRFVPGNISVCLKKGKAFVIRVSIEEESLNSPAELIKRRDVELTARKKETAEVTDVRRLLRYNARHFLLVNPSGKKSVNAGYPWFGEWGRDTMIALPGLTCYNGMTDYCVDVLCDYISMIRDGLLPNTLGDTQGYTSYNSIDAGLLFCRAVINLNKTGYGETAAENEVLLLKIKPAVLGIVNAFIEGRVPEARLDSSGLISSGSVDTQLTWMDATAWGKPVTPRHGFAVDLNALWYDALVLLKALCEEDPPHAVEQLIEKIPASFREKFWMEEGGYLSDTVSEGKPDGKIRPNMLFASSASAGLLDARQRAAVVKTAEEQLLTPMGLRTLAPGDKDFQPVYSGGADERDSKYHQGTVWPWLIGIMIESSLAVSGESKKKAAEWKVYLDNLLEKHGQSQGWGYISEIFDGMQPEGGKGCFAQAWSSGEVIRSYELIKRILN